MKIVMLVSNPYETDHRVQKEAKTLLQQGHSVKVFCWNFRRFPRRGKKDGIVVEEFILKSPRGSKNLLGAYIGLLRFQLWSFFRLIKDDFDVVHCHNFDTLIVGYFAGKLKKKRIVFDIHDLYFTYPTLEKESRLLRFTSKVLQRLEMWFVGRVDSIIVTTPKYYEYYSKIASQKPMIILYNSPEKAFSESTSPVNQVDEFVVSYIGSVRYEKQLNTLIKATGSMPQVKVLIVGGGVKAEKIKNKTKNNKHVVFIDEVSYSKIADYYKISDCIFSLYDTKDENTKYLCPVKVLEAMAFGIPVIVAKNSYAGEFVEENKVGLAIEDDPLELEKSILLLKSDNRLYGELKSNGLRLFKEKFNWETTSKDLLRMYKTLGRGVQ